MTEDEVAEAMYRDKLVDWMAAQDISTGVSALAFDDLLRVIADYIAALKKRAENANAE